MKTFNIRIILKIALIFICALFYPINNQAGESISETEYKSQIVKKIKDSQDIVKDTICLINWHDKLTDTSNDLTKSPSSTDGNKSLLSTVEANVNDNSNEKLNTETKPRKLAYVLFDILKKMLSLMLNK